MTPEELRAFLESGDRTWIFAKTMTTFPHHYIRRAQFAGNEATFEAVVTAIRQHGKPRQWHKRTFVYFDERMAATIRHNRARGEHSIGGMSNMVFSLLNNGWSDGDICRYLGLEPEELLKLKHITGFSALFKNKEYSRAWETKAMIRLRLQHSKRGAS